jgi:hypothetical protein
MDPTPLDERDRETTWAKPIDRLSLGVVPTDAINLNVSGKRLSGPLQGFGQLWQKTYQIEFKGADPPPRDVVAIWKREFGSFWPNGQRFYAPFAETSPGEVGLINGEAPGRQVLSTGVMVIYADDESFTFMTPEGHVFAAWITCSATTESGATIARISALLRASDPLFEFVLMAGGHDWEDDHWKTTLTNLAARNGATGVPTAERVCVDPRRQWRHARNVRHNAAIRSGIWMMAHPRRMIRRPKD